MHYKKSWSILLGLYVAALMLLGLQGWIRGDTRWAFGMFSHEVRYSVEYAWVKTDGAVVPYTPGLELRGRARDMIEPVKRKSTRYGIGALRGWIGGFVKRMYTQRPHLGTTAFQATLRYKVNRKGEWKEEIIRYPKEQ